MDDAFPGDFPEPRSPAGRIFP